MVTKKTGVFLAGCLLVCLQACLLTGCGKGPEARSVDASANFQEDAQNDGDVLMFSAPVVPAATLPPAITYASPAPALAGNQNEVVNDVLLFSETPTPTLAPTTPPTPSFSPTPSPTAAPTPTPAYTLTKVKNEKGHVKGRDVNLREGPGEQYDVIQQVAYLTSVVITGKTTIKAGKTDQTWYCITFGGTTGFMLKDWVGLGAEPTPTPKPKATATPKPAKTAAPESDTGQPDSTVDHAASGNAGQEIRQGGSGNYSEADIYLAAKLIYAEGKNQSAESFLAMANVLYNRCNSKKFGGTVEKEVYRSGQFTVVKYDSFEGLTPSANALDAARDVFNNGVRVLPEGVLFFRSASKGEYWSSSRKFYRTIGGNNYYY